MTIEDLRALVRWCDDQTETLWRPESGDLPLTAILALYHASADAGFDGMDGWWSCEPDRARAAWFLERGRAVEDAAPAVAGGAS